MLRYCELQICPQREVCSLEHLRRTKHLLMPSSADTDYSQPDLSVSVAESGPQLAYPFIIDCGRCHLCCRVDFKDGASWHPDLSAQWQRVRVGWDNCPPNWSMLPKAMKPGAPSGPVSSACNTERPVGGTGQDACLCHLGQHAAGRGTAHTGAEWLVAAGFRPMESKHRHPTLASRLTQLLRACGQHALRAFGQGSRLRRAACTPHMAVVAAVSAPSGACRPS